MKKTTLKLLCLILTLCICLPFVACDKNGSKETTPTSQSEVNTTEETTKETSEETSKETTEKETEVQTEKQSESETEIDLGLDTPEKIIAAAYALERNEILAGGSYTLEGYVAKITKAYSNGKISFQLVVPGFESQPIICNDIVVESQDQVAENDTVAVTGTIKNASWIVQFGYGATLDSVVKTSQDPEILAVFADSLFADIDRENITDHVEFIRDFDNGIHVEYLTTDIRTMSYTGKVMRSRTDRNVTVHAYMTLHHTTLHRTYEFTVKAGEYVERFDRPESDPTVHELTVTSEDPDTQYFFNWMADQYRNGYNPVGTVIVDLKDCGVAMSLEQFSYILSANYFSTFETLELQGDSDNIVCNRKIKVHVGPHGYDLTYPKQTDLNTYAKIPDLNAILRQRSILDSPYRRADDFNDFGLIKNNKGEKEVHTPEEMQKAMESGYLPVFPVENTKAEYYFECMKTILRDIISNDMNDIQKVSAIYEYIGQAASYESDALFSDKDNLAAYSIDSFFDEGRTVCNGYAGVFSLLCNLEGINCCEIWGISADNSGGHAWNLAEIEGLWYFFCPTSATICNFPNHPASEFYGDRHEYTYYGFAFCRWDRLSEIYPTLTDPLPDYIDAAKSNQTQTIKIFENYMIADGVDCHISDTTELGILLDTVLSADLCGTYTFAFTYKGHVDEYDIKQAFADCGFTDYFLTGAMDSNAWGSWQYAFITLRFGDCKNPPLWGGGETVD